MTWYYLKDGWLGSASVIGPLSEDAFRMLEAQGVITTKTMVRHPRNTLDQWARLGELKERPNVEQSTTPPQVFMAQAIAEPEATFRCPFCGTAQRPIQRHEMTAVGVIVCIVLFLLLCWPLCWIGLFIREHHTYCSRCGMRLN